MQHCNSNLTVICVWIAGCQRLLLTVKKMSGQVRWRRRFIKNKTLDYEVRRNSRLVEARKRKYSAGNFTYASKLVVCACVSSTYSRQAGEREQCCRMTILLRLSVTIRIFSICFSTSSFIRVLISFNVIAISKIKNFHYLLKSKGEGGRKREGGITTSHTAGYCTMRDVTWKYNIKRTRRQG